MIATTSRFQLRDYQRRAVDNVIAALGRRPILVSPTGSGKTTCGTEIVERLGVPTLWMAHRKELIDQAADRLAAHGLDVGIVMSGYEADADAQVQVASIQTLVRRDKPPARLIVIDECHRAAADTYQRVLDDYPDAYVLGLTATPFRLDGRGLGELFGELVVAAWPDELCESGVLHKPRVWASKAPDLRGLRVVAGDYSVAGLAMRSNTAELNADIVETWKNRAAGRRTVAFAVDIDHSQAITRAFRDEGIPAEHLDGATVRPERDAILDRLGRGETHVVSNCMVLTEGWDLPALECAVIARPTASLNLHCLDDRTEILTVNGWRGRGQIVPGDSVATWSDGVIRWEPALATIDRDANPTERFYTLCSPRMDFRITNAHRLVWRGRLRAGDKSPVRVSTADQVFGHRRSSVKLPVSGIEPLPPAALTDDEVRFIGWVLTDGCLNRTSRQVVISQSERYPDHLTDIRRVLHSCGFKFSERLHNGAGQFSSPYRVHCFSISCGKPRGTQKDRRGYAALERYLDKGNPAPLRELDARQFSTLLEAMHSGNGQKSVSKGWVRRSYHISTGRRALADGIQALAITRGWACNVSRHRNVWMLHLKQQLWRTIAGSTDRDRPHVRSERASGRVWCVETPSGTILTRRNGKVLVLGNCQMIGRVMRACDGKDGAIVLDHAGNHHVHGLVTRRLNYTLSDEKVGFTEPLGLRRCGECGVLFETSEPCCPECGWVPVTTGAGQRHRPAIHGDAELTEFDDMSFEYRRQIWIQIESQRMASGYRPGWSFYRFRDRFGFDPVVADGELVDPPRATMSQKREVYKRFVCIADARGYRIGWAAYRFRDTFGHWPRGFVEEVRREVCA